MHITSTCRRLVPIAGLMMALSAVAQPLDPPASQPETPLARRVRTLLREGKLNDAVAAVQEAYRRAPDDPLVRVEFVELHLTLAEHLLADQQFDAAQRVARAVLRVEPDHRAARRILDGLAAARRDAPRRADEARRMIGLEWYEPAYEALSRAIALRPERQAEWTAELAEAAEGAGDDHFFCKNFREAFFYYDVVRRSGRPISDALKRRWLLSQVLSLADDVERVRYPIEYWHKIVTTAEPLAARRSDPLLAVLRGLANENLNDPRRAAANYADATHVELEEVNATTLRAARRAAVEVVRQQYDESLSPRRSGVWRRHEPGEWLVLKTPHFVVHHRNAEVGRRVGDALEYHYARIARYLGTSPEKVPWKSCDVFVHKDLAAFRAASKRGAAERAISVTRLTGGRLHSQEVHVMQSDPMLLSARLPHELMHLMIGAITDYKPTCAILNEGLALSVEPRCRAVQFDRVLAEERGARPVATLLKLKEPHPAQQRRFYGEARRLVAMLLSRGPASKVVAAAADEKPESAMLRLFDIRDMGELDGKHNKDKSG